MIEESYDIKEVIMCPLWPLTVISTIALLTMFGFFMVYGCQHLDDITCSLT